MGKATGLTGGDAMQRFVTSMILGIAGGVGAVVLARPAAPAVPSFVAQVPSAAPHPTFAGTWAPSEPAKNDQLFAVGLTRIPGQGRLTIEQRADRFMVTITVPDEKLDVFLKFDGRFYMTVVYRLSEARGRSGGAGAGGAPRPSEATWFGDRLVIPDPQPAARPVLWTYSLEGDRLKLETHVDLPNGRANDVTEWFKRIQ
jgi:hypothetical protein